MVATIDSDEVRAVPEVPFGEELGSMQSVEHLRDLWERVLVLQHGFIESSVVQPLLRSSVHHLCKSVGCCHRE